MISKSQILDRVRSWLPSRGEQRSFIGGGYVPAAPVLSGTYVTPETALGLAAVYAAVNLISGDIATLPCNVYQRLAHGGRKIDWKHPVQSLLAYGPNDDVDVFRWWQSTVSHVLTRGNGYSEIVRDKAGNPVAFHLLHPMKVKAEYGEKGGLRYELLNNASNASNPKLIAENVLHFAGMGFNGIQGYSPITVARQTVGLGLAVEQFGAAFFGNSAIPKGMFKTSKKLGPGAADNFRRTVNQVHQGSQSAHQFLMLSDGWEWVQTQFSAEDAQFLSTRQFQVKEIARLYNLPPHKLSDYSESHLANVEEASLDYISMTLVRWVRMLEAQLNHKLLRSDERRTHCIAFDLTALMRGNTDARTKYYQGMRNMGCFSADDILLAEGRNPIGPEKGGDLYLVQAQYRPLGLLGQPSGPDETMDLDHEGHGSDNSDE